VSILDEAAAEKRSQRGIVFDHKNAHRSTSTTRARLGP
jgi:hypothetical protein